jgi:hypothetical protein
MNLHCPECFTPLGGWGLVIVHDIHYGRWFYRCSCGWQSTQHKTESGLRMYANLARRRRKHGAR